MSIVYFFDKHLLDNIEFALKKLRIEKSIERNDMASIDLINEKSGKKSLL